MAYISCHVHLNVLPIVEIFQSNLIRDDRILAPGTIASGGSRTHSSHPHSAKQVREQLVGIYIIIIVKDFRAIVVTPEAIIICSFMFVYECFISTCKLATSEGKCG